MDDLISRQAAIDTILSEPPDAHYPIWYAERIKKLPSAEPEIVETVNEEYLTDWYINSVDNDQPIWTEEHIRELMGDFYLIPKEKK